MKVKRLPRDPGPAAWNELLGDGPPVQVQEGPITADWLVIGAGFAGLAAARRLSMTRPGDRIVLLEALRVGEGPAGRNSGFMIDLPHDISSENYSGGVETDRKQTEANRRAIAFSREAAEAYGLPDEAFGQPGKINAAATERGMAHNRDYGAHLAAMGEGHEHYDAQTMREITGSSYYLGGLFTPGVAMIQPALFVRGLAGGLTSNRVGVYENSPVTGLAREGTDWVATTPKGRVSAPRVILAVNGHVESFGFFERRLMHVFTYASMTRALSGPEVARLGGHPTWGATPADPMGTTVRRISGTGGDRIIVRNRFTFDADLESPENRLTRIAATHDRSFAARFPNLSHVSMEYRWGGKLCLSRNDAPAFGEVEEGIFAACCQNGIGTAKGTYNGIAAADLAAGLSTEFTQHLETAEDPVRLPPEPLASIGATAVIRFNEWRAGREL